jgi:hypothetical protein
VWYAIELNLIEEEEPFINTWEIQNTYGKLLELITSLALLKVALMVLQPFLLWLVT